jgi:hypothetical protein
VAATAGSDQSSTVFTVADRASVETMVIKVFTEVLLSGELVTRDSDFFEIGGDSILAGKVIARLRPRLPVPVSLRDLFTASTPAGLAEIVSVRQAGTR